MNDSLLVLEDEADIARLYSEYFSQLGFRVECTHEVRQARELVVKNRYGVLVSDLCLGDGKIENGLDFVDFIHFYSPWTAVAVVSGALSGDTASRARHLGAKVVLEKPLPIAEIGKAVLAITPYSAAQLTHSSPSGMEIAQLVVSGMNCGSIAKMYGLDETSVKKIVKSWLNSLSVKQRIGLSFKLSREDENWSSLTRL